MEGLEDIEAPNQSQDQFTNTKQINKSIAMFPIFLEEVVLTHLIGTVLLVQLL